MQSVTRRNFLKGVAVAGAAAAAAAGLAPSAFAAGPHIHFPVKPRERLSVTPWPFRAYIESPTNHDRNPKLPGMNLTDFAAMVAEKFDVHNINPLSWHFSSTSPAYIAAFRKSVEKAGSHIVGLGLEGGNFYNPDSSIRKRSVMHAKKWIDIAAEIGSPSVRPAIDAPHRIKPNVGLCALSYGELAEYGAKKNIVVNMENDDPYTQDPFFTVAVIKKVDNPYLRSLPDFGNSSVKGPDFNARALTAMFSVAYNMSHVKNAVTGEHGKVFKVDFDRIFGIAKASDYRGWYSMEYDTDFGDPYAGTRELIKETLAHLA
ncbi:MAG: sugar phosphate isomerase/epimerase [Acidobacteriota bacterium]|nr:sugar phosphate isomerase/epimerase [Acidobacteriota bacterium]